MWFIFGRPSGDLRATVGRPSGTDGELFEKKWWGDFGDVVVFFGDVVGILWRCGGDFLWREQGFMIFCKKGTKVSTSRKYATKGKSMAANSIRLK